MEIQRTSNAGVLLKLDDVTILLDGFCSQVDAYEGTPEQIRNALFETPPDVLAFTHRHADHFDASLVKTFENQFFRPILGPEDLGVSSIQTKFSVGKVAVTPVPSRHLGKTQPGLGHFSYVIQGSQCVWFLGDAAPSQWQGREELPKPDVLIAPYAYALTESAWRRTCAMTDTIVLLHLPNPGKDVLGLRDQVKHITAQSSNIVLYLPEIGSTICP